MFESCCYKFVIVMNRDFRNLKIILDTDNFDKFNFIDKYKLFIIKN